MNKKTEYSTGIVMMVIFLLALFIILPPVFRTFFPEEETNQYANTKFTITCAKKGVNDDIYSNASVSIYYENGVIKKNTINFYYSETQSREVEKKEEVGESNIIEDSEQVVSDDTTNNQAEVPSTEEITEGEDLENINPTERTISQEAEFFKSLKSVNYTENEGYVTVEITKESLAANEGSNHLSNYFMNDMTEQERFYMSLKYICMREQI